MPTALSLGIDFGTSGARAIAIDPEARIQSQVKVSFGTAADSPKHWQTVLFELLLHIPLAVRRQITAVAINGTSSTVLLCDAQGQPIDSPLLYHDGRGIVVLPQLQAMAPPQHPVISATSSLAKLLWWLQHRPERIAAAQSPVYFLHQADWLAFLLHGRLGISDYHNALKLGYDVAALTYPAWLPPLPVQLPQVVAPGTPIAAILPEVATSLELPAGCLICAGTTDSIAAFLASGAQHPGEAVTSLGSTLVLKLLSETRVDQVEFGVYSHRLGDLWLVGGASNTGGAVLSQFFSETELQQLSQRIVPERPSSLEYYPLLKPGERFPVNDPTLLPCLEPRPSEAVEFLHGLLESMARIEAQGYRLLQSLGASVLTRVYTAGGGAQNDTWTAIRRRHLSVPVVCSEQVEAAYGTALLAQRGGAAWLS
ncbi:MAG: FGGY-family carbohydrate kinase [Synechococcales cyanobacterium C42_A2020_086]|jgi:xylulokinase|nr:FGGY-family carbohydrate kinase [Synechococcales cyanobacterium C42_A2020_086]